MIKKIVKSIISFILDFLYNVIKLFEMSNKMKIKEAKKEINSVYRKKSLIKEKYKYLKDEVDLSIIIPIYNGQEYIDKCLHSLLHQNTKYKTEIIVCLLYTSPSPRDCS